MLSVAEALSKNTGGGPEGLLRDANSDARLVVRSRPQHLTPPSDIGREPIRRLLAEVSPKLMLKAEQ